MSKGEVEHANKKRDAQKKALAVRKGKELKKKGPGAVAVQKKKDIKGQSVEATMMAMAT